MLSNENFTKYLRFKKRSVFYLNIQKGYIPCVSPDCEEWVAYKKGDDEFVKFLDETGDYKSIISSFKFSLSLLFIALLYSIVLTVISSYFKTLGHINQQFYFLTIFIFLFSYSLLATFISTFDAIKYSSFRTEYLKIKKPVK